MTFAEGDQVLVLYSASAKRRNKHYMASEGPCTVTKINGNDYEVRNNATNNVKSVHWSVLHRVYDRRLSQSSGAGRGTTDAEDATRADAPGARDALITRHLPGAHDQQPERQRQAAPSVADAPGAQGQQPGRTETVKDKQGRKPGGSKTVKDRTRDKNVLRALGPDVVDDKGQRVPFSRRGSHGSPRAATTTTETTRPFHGHPGRPSLGFPCRSR